MRATVTEFTTPVYRRDNNNVRCVHCNIMVYRYGYSVREYAHTQGVFTVCSYDRTDTKVYPVGTLLTNDRDHNNIIVIIHYITTYLVWYISRCLCCHCSVPLLLFVAATFFDNFFIITVVDRLVI